MGPPPPCFVPLPQKTGLLRDLLSDPFPAEVFGIAGRNALSLVSGSTSYGFLGQGRAELQTASGAYELTQGQYFSFPGDGTLQGVTVDAAGIIIRQHADHGFFQLGGPIEDRGRLRYIDGCTDSLLLAPPILGAPCLNLLHIPPHTKQSRHSHPSFRIGWIVKGAGACVTPTGDYPLEAGHPFHIPAGALHSFHTVNDELLVIAYHPDSDFGPTHEIHPMVNRTILPTS
ncbi:MAG: cupin domain-containing protein [Verrucomicrobiota bacterium]